MEYEVFKTIKSKHFRWNRIQCQSFVDKFIDKLSKWIPDGIPENQYIVLPGYEHITRYQPIIVYNQEAKIYQLTNDTKFFKPIKLKENATSKENSESSTSSEGDE